MVNNVKVIVDTGPLVAFINKRDTFHEWVKQQLAALNPPLFTCEAVLSEAAFLLRHLPRGRETLLECLKRDLVRIAFSVQEEAGALLALITRYQNVPMSLADACLVRMSEQSHGCHIFTLDSHFQIYRKHGRQIIPTVSP